MGWTGTYIYGTAKEELDRLYSFEGEKFSNKVIKSAMVGSTYYCAVEKLNKETSEKEVWAGIALTSQAHEDGCNFFYKDMDETEGPCECKCPKSILNLLTPTESEYAMDWRERCLKALSSPKLTDIKVGQKILWQGKTLTKMAPNYQFKRNWWYCAESNTYVPSSRIKEWEVVA